MNPILLHFASGLSLFSGGLLLVLLIAIKSYGAKKVPAWLVDVPAIVGILLMILSATPMPWIIFTFVLGSVMLWTVLIHFSGRTVRLIGRVGALCIVLVVSLMAFEIPYVITPRVSHTPDAFYVIGDSISAGIGGVKWPDILHERRGADVRNLAVAGSTATSAMSQVEKVPADGKLVLVEIGGNDLLGGNTAEEFGAALDRLLKKLDGHPIIMFELPLYPWTREFGFQQRLLASRYGVSLIPKRKMAWVFSGDDATVDGLHLSEIGANRMAEIVADVLGIGNGR